VKEYPEANHLLLDDAGDDLIPRIAAFCAQHKHAEQPRRP
jgi:hypothetical protein